MPWYDLTSFEVGMEPFWFIGVSIEICCLEWVVGFGDAFAVVAYHCSLKGMARTCSQLFVGRVLYFSVVLVPYVSLHVFQEICELPRRGL